MFAGLLAAAACAPPGGGDSDTTTDPTESTPCDEPIGPGFTIASAEAWHRVDGVPCGDVNGDGLADIVIVAAHDLAYVVFGKSDAAPIALADLSPDEGFAITVEASADGDELGVYSVGDVDGDGFDDLAATLAGQVRLLAGGPESHPWVLQADESLPPLLVDGLETSSMDHVFAAGDLNGDGFGDILVNDNTAYFSTHYVIFGEENPGYHSRDDLAAEVGGAAIVAYGSVLATGDVDGDGFDDLAVASSSGVFGQGFDGVEVVFGGPAIGSLEFFDDLWPIFEGYSIRLDGAYLRIAVDGGRDVDGDGRTDFVIRPDMPGEPAWILFGQSGVESVLLPQDLTDGSGFSVLQGAELAHGRWPYLLQDLNDDGRAEIVVFEGEEAYVVRGKADLAPVDLSEVASGIGGYALRDRPWARQGAVAWAEIDGSPGVDAIVSAPAVPGERYEAGCTYVYFAPEGR